MLFNDCLIIRTSLYIGLIYRKITCVFNISATVAASICCAITLRFFVTLLLLLTEKTTKEMTETEMQSGQKSPQAVTKRPRYKNTVHLWEFLLELLADEQYSNMIAWSRKDYGEFKLKNQEEVARRWGIVKHRAGMNYEKLSRAIRYYYHQGIIQKVWS